MFEPRLLPPIPKKMPRKVTQQQVSTGEPAASARVPAPQVLVQVPVLDADPSPDRGKISVLSA
jgi:hypothetical protein